MPTLLEFSYLLFLVVTELCPCVHHMQGSVPSSCSCPFLSSKKTKGYHPFFSLQGTLADSFSSG